MLEIVLGLFKLSHLIERKLNLALADICYHPLTMKRHLTPVDISNMPELAQIAEEVEATKIPRELKRENKTVTVIVPATKPAEKKREKTNADYEAFKSTASGWKDIDTDKFLEDISADRTGNNSRPPIKL